MQLAQRLEFSDNKQQIIDHSPQEGKIGPERVVLDAASLFGAGLLEGETAEGQSNFTSVRANACCWKGKWMYEVILLSHGVQQIGWAQLKTVFGAQEGVGDSKDSYSYDGNRRKKWHGPPKDYGDAWATGMRLVWLIADFDAGDVIGCCFDADEKRIEFFRNGRSMGVAFDEVVLGNGCAYFPAASLSFGERSTFNFGNQPFFYPIDGYAPLQHAPWSLNRARYLIACAERLTAIDTLPPDDIVLSASIIFAELSTLLQSGYIVSAALLPVLVGLDDRRIERFLHFAEVCLEEGELNDCFQRVFALIAERCQISAFRPEGETHYEMPTSSIRLLLRVLRNQRVMGVWLSHPRFAQLLESYFCLGTPSVADIKVAMKEVTLNEQHLRVAQERLVVMRKDHENLLVDLVTLMLRDTESRVIEENGRTIVVSPSRKLLTWLRGILAKNRDRLHNPPPPGLSDLDTLVELFFVLLRVVGESCELNAPISQIFSEKIFYHSDINYFEWERIGGLLNHIKKEIPLDADGPREVPPAVELMDGLILLGRMALVQKLKTALFRLEGWRTAKQQRNAQQKLDSNGGDNHKARDVFALEVNEAEKLVAWYTLVLLPQRMDNLFQLIQFDAKLLCELSPGAFSYVPEFYLSFLLEVIRFYESWSPAHINSEKLREIAVFIALHGTDRRIVNPDTRDTLLATLFALLEHENAVELLGDSEAVLQSFFPNLIRAFDQRFWLAVANLIIRVWKGTGLAQDAKQVPEGLRKLRESFVATIATESAAPFLNKLFDNLNLLLSEIVMALEEVPFVGFSCLLTFHSVLHFIESPRGAAHLAESSNSDRTRWIAVRRAGSAHQMRSYAV